MDSLTTTKSSSMVNPQAHTKERLVKLTRMKKNLIKLRRLSSE